MFRLRFNYLKSSDIIISQQKWDDGPTINQRRANVVDGVPTVNMYIHIQDNIHFTADSMFKKYLQLTNHNVDKPFNRRSWLFTFLLHISFKHA